MVICMDISSLCLCGYIQFVFVFIYEIQPVQSSMAAPQSVDSSHRKQRLCRSKHTHPTGSLFQGKLDRLLN